MMSVALAPLHPDAAMAVSGCPDAQRAAAITLFQEELRDLQPHRNCTLTGDGFPLLCTFTTADTALRWTADLCPSGDHRTRLTVTRQAFQRLACRKVAPPLGGTSRYGAWLGGRVASDGALSYKLYQEPSANDAVQSGPLADQSIAGFTPRLQMVGYGPEAERREYYYRFDHSTPYLLKRLLETADLGERFQDAIAIICDSARQSDSAQLPGGAMGASFAYDDTGAPPQLTLYFYTRPFWGSDAAIHQTFTGLLQSVGRDPRPYAAASGPLKSRHKLRTYHDTAALMISDRGHAWGVGLRPTIGAHN